MSRVLEHGKYLDVRFKLTCPACGCVFIATSLDFSDGCMMGRFLDDNNIHICPCPECKMKIGFGPNQMNQVNKALIEVNL